MPALGVGRTLELQIEGGWTFLDPFSEIGDPPLVDHAFISISFSELCRTIPLILKLSILKKVEFFGTLFLGVF